MSKQLADLQIALENFSKLSLSPLNVSDAVYDKLKAVLTAEAIFRFSVIFEPGHTHLIRQLAAALEAAR
jgi:hypothetical protein